MKQLYGYKSSGNEEIIKIPENEFVMGGYYVSDFFDGFCDFKIKVMKTFLIIKPLTKKDEKYFKQFNEKYWIKKLEKCAKQLIKFGEIHIPKNLQKKYKINQYGLFK